MNIKKLITLEERLEFERQRFLDNFVTNVREVEHLGIKMKICENMNGSTKIYHEERYIQIGMYDNKPLYQQKQLYHLQQKNKK